MGYTEIYDYWVEKDADPRTKEWFLIGSPYPTIIILLSYSYFIFKCGPRYMEHRKPYSFKTFLFYYNIYQIVANALLVYGLLDAGWFTTISLGCEPVDYSMNPQALKLASIVWWTFMSRLVDLLETIMFVLRKKNRQISTLHVYHHISTVSLIWAGTRYLAGGMTTFCILVNSSVHVIMYTYYLLSSQGEIFQRILQPIKPYITIVQMVQFVALVLHTIQMLMPGCDITIWAGIIFNFNLGMNFYLFYDFYQKNYVKAKKN